MTNVFLDLVQSIVVAAGCSRAQPGRQWEDGSLLPSSGWVGRRG
jgi:hypothetical protein